MQFLFDAESFVFSFMENHFLAAKFNTDILSEYNSQHEKNVANFSYLTEQT